MSKDSHAFNISVACEVGVSGAIMMQHFLFLQKSNITDGENWQQKWVRRSAKSIAKTYPYWSGKQIASIADNLEKGEYIFSKIENASKIDRTKSYILTAKGLLLMGEIPFAQMENGFSKKGNAIAEMENDILPNGEMLIKVDYTSFIHSFVEREEKEKTSPPPSKNISLEAEKETPPQVAPVPPADPTRLTIHDPEAPDAAILDIVSTEPQTQPPANRINLGDRATAETPTQLHKELLAFYNSPDWQGEWLDGVWRINGVWIPDNSEKQGRLESILLDFCCHTVKKNGGRDTYRELNAGFQQWVRNEKNAFWKQKPASTTNTPATDSNFYRRNQQTK